MIKNRKLLYGLSISPPFCYCVKKKNIERVFAEDTSRSLSLNERPMAVEHCRV
jgi:hypothetical protein